MFFQSTSTVEATMEIDMLRKGTWLEHEDDLLTTFVKLMGERRWDSLARASGLRRSGRSCRLRWLNYLRPNLKHGHFTVAEEHIILQLHQLWGNKWSKIALRLPGRTDNEIKNHWRTHLKKKVQVLQLQDTRRASIDNQNSDDIIAQKICKCEDQSFDSVVENLWGTNNEPCDHVSNQFESPSSPYETRLSIWISELSNDHQSEVNYSDECNSMDSANLCNSMDSTNLCNYLDWTPDDSDTWNYSGFLWDMN